MLIRNREFMYDEVGVIRNREFTFDEGDDTLNVLPCFSGLRLLAVWQANNAHWTLKIYNFWVCTVFSYHHIPYLLTCNYTKRDLVISFKHTFNFISNGNTISVPEVVPTLW